MRPYNHLQPWIKEREDKNLRMKEDIAEQKDRMKSVPSLGRMRVKAKISARETSKPTIDDGLTNKVQEARKSRGRAVR